MKRTSSGNRYPPERNRVFDLPSVPSGWYHHLLSEGNRMKLGVIEYIDCAHYLPGHPRCGALHGHTYKVEVIVEGENRSGMVVDFSDLKKIVREALAVYDHRSLNDFLEYPSVENICEALHRDLSSRLGFPFTIRVWEGHGKWAELAPPGTHQ